MFKKPYDAGDVGDVGNNKRRSRSPIFNSMTSASDVCLSDSGSEYSGTSVVSKEVLLRRNKVQARSSGISQARTDLRKSMAEAKEVAFNEQLKKRIFFKASTEADFNFDSEAVLSSEGPSNEDTSRLNSEELRAAAGRNVATIIQVATKSKNLKGTFVKCLKESATAMQEIVDTLASRTESEESRRLRIDNMRLRTEVENLKAELKAHRREFSEMRTSMAATNGAAAAGDPVPPLNGEIIEDLKASIVSSVGVMLDARFAGIEERLLPEKLLRPALAADKRRHAMVKDIPSAAHSTALTSSSAHEVPVAAPGSSRPLESDDWSSVVKKGKKGGKKASAPVGTDGNVAAGSTAPPKAPITTKPKVRKGLSLASPKTAAVIITLQPEAEKKGVTYAQVIERAEQRVNLQELGIGEGLRIRRAMTGARLLELPKEQSQEQAELLAEKLRTALNGIASVVRPTKTATLRIFDLDDSVTAEKVAAAVAKAGKCPVQSVRVGEVQIGRRGMGMVTVHCSVEVAKTISDAQKLLVGWSSARVEVLEQRPLRCFKCQGIGHTRPVCPSTVNRDNLCFRCGSEGHRASVCTGTMRCAVCADAGLPSGHVMGGSDCRPPPTKGKANTRINSNEGPGQAAEEDNMSS